MIGMRVWNKGVVTLDMTTRHTNYLGSFEIPEGKYGRYRFNSVTRQYEPTRPDQTTGSHSDSRLAMGTPFVMPCKNSTNYNGPWSSEIMPSITIDGTTIRWMIFIDDDEFDDYVVGGFTVYYGIY